MDGDTVFALATGAVEVEPSPDTPVAMSPETALLTAIGVAAADCLARAVLVEQSASALKAEVSPAEVAVPRPAVNVEEHADDDADPAHWDLSGVASVVGRPGPEKDDLEDELNEALGDASLDELMAGGGEVAEHDGCRLRRS